VDAGLARLARPRRATRHRIDRSGRIFFDPADAVAQSDAGSTERLIVQELRKTDMVLIDGCMNGYRCEHRDAPSEESSN
jgi:hypothetical protein